MLADTDILIWYLRGYESAARFLAERSLALSAVTYMELVQGMRNRGELLTLRRTLRSLETPVLPITEVISQQPRRSTTCRWLLETINTTLPSRTSSSRYSDLSAVF